MTPSAENSPPGRNSFEDGGRAGGSSSNGIEISSIDSSSIHGSSGAMSSGRDPWLGPMSILDVQGLLATTSSVVSLCAEKRLSN